MFLSVGVRPLAALVLVAAATAMATWLAYYCARSLTPAGTRAYVTLAFPFLFGLMMAGGTLIAGFTSRYTTGNDEEWWARAGAWMMIVSAAWLGLCVLVLWIPEYVLHFIRDFMRDPAALFASWSNM